MSEHRNSPQKGNNMQIRQALSQSHWMPRMAPIQNAIVKFIAFVVICQGSVFAQQARFFGYRQGYSNYYSIELPLGTTHMELRQIVGDTLVDNSTWYIMKTTASGNGQSGSQFWYVRAHDTIIGDRAVTIDAWTKEFPSTNSTIYEHYPADTVVNDTRIKTSSRCNEFRNYIIYDSCISIASIGPSSKSFRTYSKQRGLIYAVDSFKVFDSPVRYCLELDLPVHVQIKEGAKNKTKPMNVTPHLVNGSRTIRNELINDVKPLF